MRAARAVFVATAIGERSHAHVKIEIDRDGQQRTRADQRTRILAAEIAARDVEAGQRQYRAYVGVEIEERFGERQACNHRAEEEVVLDDREDAEEQSAGPFVGDRQQIVADEEHVTGDDEGEIFETGR